jgi:hypothetical protein
MNSTSHPARAPCVSSRTGERAAPLGAPGERAGGRAAAALHAGAAAHLLRETRKGHHRRGWAGRAACVVGTLRISIAALRLVSAILRVALVRAPRRRRDGRRRHRRRVGYGGHGLLGCVVVRRTVVRGVPGQNSSSTRRFDHKSEVKVGEGPTPHELVPQVYFRK